MGIQSGGVDLAVRLAKLFKTFYSVEPPTGAIDITFYRDDLDVRLGREVRPTEGAARPSCPLM